MSSVSALLQESERQLWNVNAAEAPKEQESCKDIASMNEL